MDRDNVWLSVAEHAAAIGVCELCVTDGASLEAAVVVHHAHGATVQFVACDRCARALRRVLAAIGADGQITRATTVAASPTHSPSPVPMLRPRPRPRVLRAEVLAELADHVVGPDGTHYVVRVCGGPLPSGTWVGWLEFVAVGKRRVRRTRMETTQPHRDDLLHWASVLGPAFIEGAFARAR